jgi:hypothetical protein
MCLASGMVKMHCKSSQCILVYRQHVDDLSDGASTYPQLQAAVLQIPLGDRHVIPELHIVASLHFAPSPPAGGELLGFGEADVCIFVGAGVVGAAPALVGQLAPSAAYFVFTRPVSCHSTPLITLFLSPLGLPCMFEKASIMMSMEPGD